MIHAILKCTSWVYEKTVGLIEFAAALISTFASCGKYSLHGFSVCHLAIHLLSQGTLTPHELQKLQKILQESAADPKQMAHWIHHTSTFAKGTNEQRATTTLKKLFNGWQLAENKDTYLRQITELLKAPKELLGTNIKIQSFVLQTIKFMEAIKEIEKKIALPQELQLLSKEMQDAYTVSQRLLFEVRKLDAWSPRVIITHEADKLNALHTPLAETPSRMCSSIRLGYSHSGFVKMGNTPEERRLGKLYNSHVTEHTYEQSPLRDIELLGSRFIVLNPISLVTAEKQRELCKKLGIHNESDLEKILNKKLDAILESLFEMALHASIKNSNWTRKITLLTSSKLQGSIEELPLTGTMQCCHFVALYTFTAIERLNKELQSMLESDFRVVKHAFDPKINPASLTPKALLELLLPISQKSLF